ncbi:MAG: endonuclease domain-containing protein [Planctomycetaceae bacterium]|nr:endonuclease domain-containing protein [Planctomycetaceae bacterium]MBT6155514.1 endonuclease domain-containing protein [Planctomycetaceae bacterium]MBT6483917.1 endonuclease domain-containing protein [Planctomycetaceae bacterium]MBT6497039.1 endonuclease domain-containing protein [Planctomycetaceae bacterium]
MQPRRPPTDKKTLARARELRRDITGPERALWKLLRDRRLRHLKFRRQHPIDCFIVDFYCHSEKLIIEVDGESHAGNGVYDNERTRRLERKGLAVLRIGNDDVLRDPESVLLVIAKAAGIDIEKWMNDAVGES